MIGLHLLAAEIGLALAVLAAAWSAVLVAADRPPGRLYLVNLIWATILIAAAAALGLAVLVTGPGPRDGLHLVYGVIAVAALPIGAAAASGRTARQRAVVALIASVVLVIVVLRLFQTAG